MKIVHGFAVALAGLGFIGASAPVTLPTHVALRSGNILDVRNVNGSITVTGGACFVVRSAQSPDRGDSDSPRVIAAATANGALVCVRYAGQNDDCNDRRGGAGEHGKTRVDLTIVVPPGVNVSARGVNGSIDIRTDARATASTVDGSIRIDAADADRVTNVNGRIALRLHARESHAPLQVTTVNGSLDVTLPAASGADVDARTLNGTIDIAGLPVHKPQYGPGQTANGALAGGGRRVDLRTLNGSIRLDRA